MATSPQPGRRSADAPVRAMPLEGLTALVTGCGRKNGIGRETASQLARAGADVAITDVALTGSRNAGESALDVPPWNGLASVVAEITTLGRRCVPLIGDVGSKPDADRLVDEAAGLLGRVDILVNNAAAPQGRDRNWTWEVPENAFDEVIRINTKGVFLMSSAFTRHLLARGAGWGRIINIASSAGLKGLPHRAAYCASKFATVGLTQVMAHELADHGVTVNAICPGAIETDRHTARVARADAAQDDAAAAARPVAAPIARLGSPYEIARLVAFLADPEAGYITGQAISIDGGLVMR